jgi:hypothetical protein
MLFDRGGISHSPTVANPLRWISPADIVFAVKN